MADLDDFFAKKDKKKGKGKKYTSKTAQNPIEQLASQSDTPPESAVKEVKLDLPSTKSKEDEWIEEKEVVEDLEGLKVSHMNVQESEVKKKTTSSQRNDNLSEVDDIDESSEGNVQTASAWHPVGSRAQDSSESSEEEEEEEKEEDKSVQPPPPAATSTKAYIPPYMRGSTASSSSSVGRPHRKSNAPPDLQSAQAFPSLQASLDTTARNQ